MFIGIGTPIVGTTSRFNPVGMFAGGEKGVVLLPENSDAAVGSGVATVTDISPNAKNATQGTGASQPILRRNTTTGALYWEFDGSNDWLQTAAVDFSATDAITVFVASRKLSDAAGGCIVELGTASGNGHFLLDGPGSAAANYFYRSKGTAIADITVTTYTSPHSAVLTGQSKISTDSSTLRLNGAQVGTSASDQGTGNYGNLALYIGRRAGTSIPFNGYIYGVIIVGRACTAAEVSATEAFFNRRIGAY